jgi:phage-related minor tail protein
MNDITDSRAEAAVEITADIRPVADALQQLTGYSEAFGRQLTSALRDAAVGGKTLEDVLRRVGLNLAGMALSRGLEPLSGVLSQLLSSGVSALARTVPFAKGGVVNGATAFPLGGATGLMGEAGAEAILPLARGADGSLGVAGGGTGQQVSVVFNVSTPDVASFRKSEAQITGMLTRAVSRGARTL